MTYMETKSGGSNLGPPRQAKDTFAATSSVLRATQAWAADKLEKWHYELQRPLVRSNVDRLSEEILGDRFVAGTPIFVCSTPDGARFLVNGQHTLTAISETGRSIDLTMITLNVPDMAAVGRTYACFDIHRIRSYASSWKAYKGSDASYLETKALTGIPFIISGFNTSGSAAPPSRDARFVALKEYIACGALEVLADAWDVGNRGGATDLSRAVKRAGIIAVALCTARYQRSVANEFWHNVITEEHPESNHPTRALARYLRGSRLGPSGHAFQMQDIYTAALAWNASWQNKSANYFKPGGTTSATFRILGTPWHKGRPE